MENKGSYPEEKTEASPVIPLVSPEEAERVFSSQRLMSLEESWAQVDKSLGRPPLPFDPRPGSP
jgi:hypothetical protein